MQHLFDRRPLRLYAFVVLALFSASIAISTISRTSPVSASSELAQIPDSLTLVGSLGGSIEAVAVDGNYAYVGEGSGLAVIDVQMTSDPVRVGRLVLTDLVS
jgi:hypothetical protein